METLKELQALPLDDKIALSRARIAEWYKFWDGDVYISFSGGKDSTVLRDLVHSMYPEVPCVWVNTGLEYPEIQQFVRSDPDSVIVRPAVDFKTVITEYGYPLISKEVSEAIYYARRKHPKISGGGGGVQTPSRSESPNQLDEANGTPRAEKRPADGKTSSASGGRGQRKNVTRQLLLGTYSPSKQWIEKHSGGAGNLKIANGPNAGVKSPFNKEKWLPIARDLPVRISHKCCDVMKKSPLNKYQRKEKLHPYLGTMAEESRLRTQAWIRHGCNAFDSTKKTSSPMAFWTEQDVLEYIKRYGLEYAAPYGDLTVDENGLLKFTGYDRTGCIYCAFGMHIEKGKSRFERLKLTHPRLYDYSVGGGQWIDNPDYDPDYDGEPDDLGWIEWNPPKLWVPSAKGLGLGKVFDMANEIMGKELWRY